MKTTKVSDWVRQSGLRRGVTWFLFYATLLAGSSAHAFLTDSGVHPPPTSGTTAYNTFKPGAAGFPSVGGTYTDSVFGSTVRRLTATTGSINQDDIYAHHWASANGTFAFTKGSAGIDIIQVATGTKPYTNQPSGLNASENYWDALIPDQYYYYSGSSLVRRNLTLQTDTTMKTFPSTLEANGGSLNIQTRDGRYFTVRYGGTNKVWDSQTDTIYSGAVTPLDLGGWVSITPDGSYMVTAAGGTGMPQKEHYSYPINHTTRTIGSTPNQFWGLCGDHGVLVSASNGKNYFVSFECYNIGAVYRIDISLDQAGRTPAQQAASNQILLPLAFTSGGHFSAVSRGALADWVFMSTENDADAFNGGVSGWTAYEQEIVAMNTVTLEVRRLAHHRSRGMSVDYQTQPRVSCSWDGSLVMWASDLNISSPTGYADMYGIQNPLGAAPPPPTIPAPTNLRVQ